MHESKIYAGRLSKLFQSLKRSYPDVEPVAYKDPIDAIVSGALCEHLNESTAKSICRKFEHHFVDINDLRVARKEEVLEIIGENTEETRAAATTLKCVLGAIFEKYDLMSLAGLTETGKRQARKELEGMDGITKFVTCYCLLTAMDGHAIPLTKKMVEYLRANQIVYANASDEDIEGFLERQINASDAYKFYKLLRYESEGVPKKKSGGKSRTKSSTLKKPKAQK